MSNETLIHFDRVQKSYDGKNLVIKNLNLEVKRGEFLTLLGASGSGKTTSLMMLAGFEEPSAGEIRMNGRPIQQLPPHKRGIGVVFQNYALFPHMTIEENLAYPLEMRGMDKGKIADEVARAVKLVRLEGMEKRRPGMLSGGQQQRVALARALIFRPELVLMDEPLGALDKNLREHMQFEIKALHRELGVTIVYVTHDQSEALTMSDRVAIFRNGDIEQIAPPGEIYANPGTAYVASFVGENNLVPARVTSRDAGGLRLSFAFGGEATAKAKDPGVDAVTMMLRPEKLRVGPEAVGLANRIEAKVKEVAYLGDHLRVLAVTSDGQELMAKVTGNLATTMGAGEELALGSPIVLGWNPEDVLIFAADKA